MTGARAAPATTHPGRILFVDAARALAVGVTMYSHALQAFGAWGPETLSAVRYATQAAPPLFILMYGMMLEVVYVPRLEHGAAGPVARRFALRSLQCLLGYAVTALAAAAAGELSGRELLEALLLQRHVPFGTILLFYAFALLAAVPLLALRRRLGSPGLIALLAAIWLARPLLAAWAPGPGWWRGPLGTLVGVVGKPLGPSVLFGMTFVIVGMVVAEPLRRRAVEGFAPFLRRLAAVSGLAGAALAGHLLADGPAVVAERLRSYRGYASYYRRGDHPAWYAAGTLYASTWLAALAALLPRNRPLPRWGRAPLEFGRSALLAFTLGNVLLILVPRALAPSSPAGRVAGALAFIAGLLGLLLAVAGARRRIAARRAGAG